MNKSYNTVSECIDMKNELLNALPEDATKLRNCAFALCAQSIAYAVQNDKTIKSQVETED